MTQYDEYGLKRFTDLLSAFGARPQAWPEAERARALSLMRATPEARRIAEREAELDRWLDEFEAPAASAVLEARILAQAPAFVRARQRKAVTSAVALERLRGWLGEGPVWITRPAYAAAVSALVGLLLGWGGVFSQPFAAGEEEEIVAMAFVGSGLERYDLGDWQ